MKILILGHNGMLGHMVKKYFTTLNFDICINDLRFETDIFKHEVSKFDGDFIINCIASIPQKTDPKNPDKFKVNTDLPIWLSNNVNVNVIHPATDCEMDEDPYGISKRLANEYIQLYSNNTKILKTSIIGPELNSHFGLMSWFSKQDKDVNGWTEAIWNGNTSLEWAKQCFKLIENWNSYSVQTVLHSDPVSKYDMLNMFNDFYEKSINIIPVKMGKNKCLIGGIKTNHIKKQLNELKIFLNCD